VHALQNTAYVLSVVILKCRMEGGNLQPFQIYLIYKISPQYYLLLGLPRFSYPTGVRVCMLGLSPLQQYIRYNVSSLNYTVLKNLKFNLNLISHNIMIVCGGRGDLHQRTFICFTSVPCMVNLEPLPLYPRERTHTTRKI
jgi:hypothetical protein